MIEIVTDDIPMILTRTNSIHSDTSDCIFLGEGPGESQNTTWKNEGDDGDENMSDQ